MVTLAGLGISEEEALEDLRKSKQELIDSLLGKKAKDIEIQRSHMYPSGECVCGGPGSCIDDWKLNFLDQAYVDKQFPSLIKESPWYYDGIYKDDPMFPELDKALYGDEDAFATDEEVRIMVKAGIGKFGLVTKDEIRQWKKEYRKMVKEKWNVPEELTDITKIDEWIRTMPKLNVYKNDLPIEVVVDMIQEKTDELQRNWSYKITEGEHAGTTLWSGRYCAVTGLIYCKIFFEHQKSCDIYVLGEKRGEGCPDYQGYWCLPCGFLEANESGPEGIARETLEETGIIIDPNKFKMFGVQTDPKKSNKGHVTLRYEAQIDYMEEPNKDKIDTNECADIRWINICNIDNYKWAFGHDKLIKNFFSTRDYNIRRFEKTPIDELKEFVKESVEPLNLPLLCLI